MVGELGAEVLTDFPQRRTPHVFALEGNVGHRTPLCWNRGADRRERNGGTIRLYNGHPPTENARRRMGLKLLVVEDQADFADFVVRGLREEGFTVESAR